MPRQLRLFPESVQRPASRLDPLRATCRAWGRGVLELLFVPQCAVCGASDCSSDGSPGDGSTNSSMGEVKLPKIRLCQTCRERLTADKHPRCGRCGLVTPRPLDPDERCAQCSHLRLAFRGVWSLGRYEGALRDATLRLKQVGVQALAATLAELLYRQWRSEIQQFQPDVISPVPMHWMRRAQRGASNPELLARRLGKLLGVPVARRLVCRNRNTAPQADLSPPERRHNVRGAFALGPGHELNSARVLIVDDIMTTGATCHEIAKILRDAGAAEVRVAVLARADGPQ